MADAPADAEAIPSVDDRQPLLQNENPSPETSQSTSIFQSVVQWTQSLRILPVLARSASASETASNPAAEASTSGRAASPFAATASPRATSPFQANSNPGSPSIGRSLLSNSPSKNDLESAALRRINSICSDSSGLKRVNGACIICMETLTPEEFASGEAITLECMCKGEMALRHKSCAEKWAQVKGSNTCDVCKAPIANLPPLPEPEEGDESVNLVISDELGDQFEEALRRREEIPAAADYIFDCIRVTWVSMIICILFFEFPVSKSFVTGLMVGIVYTGFCKIMHRSAQYRSVSASPDSPHAAATLVMA